MPIVNSSLSFLTHSCVFVYCSFTGMLLMSLLLKNLLTMLDERWFDDLCRNLFITNFNTTRLPRCCRNSRQSDTFFERWGIPAASHFTHILAIYHHALVITN